MTQVTGTQGLALARSAGFGGNNPKPTVEGGEESWVLWPGCDWLEGHRSGGVSSSALDPSAVLWFSVIGGHCSCAEGLGAVGGA